MYEGRLFRPPSEANSLIIQVTTGCSHNGCTFCSMYKEKSFRVKPIEAIRENIQQLKLYYTNPKRVFLADGDAFVLSCEKLLQIISEVKSVFPGVERISAYATPKSILLKSQEELVELKSQGLSMLYLGIESGDDAVLSFINKGATAAEIIKAGQSAVQAGMTLSVTLISGIGGKEKSMSHAIESARVVSGATVPRTHRN